MKIINGKFIEGKKVVVEIDGKVVQRRVYYNSTDGLIIWYKNMKYFENEFELKEDYK